jgi:mannosyltransferase PIG-V
VAASAHARRRTLSLRAPHELRTAAWAVLVSRLIVWGAAVPAQLILGNGFWRSHADPANLTAQMGSVGEVLGAPVMRWDSVYYLQVARDGYTQLKQAGFFPFYPLLMSVLDDVTGSTVIAGLVISLAAFTAALVLFERLAVLETGSVAIGRRAVWLLALFPASLFFSAVYTEGLFLLLSVGSFYAARRGRWAWAGILGGLAAATRNVGVTLLVPLALLYLWGPREDRPGERGRFPLRADALWLALVPLGCAAVAAKMWQTFDDPFTAWTSQESYFGRHFAGPFSGVVLGGIKAVTDLAHGNLGSAVNKGALFVVVVAALGVCVAMLRRLPVAYGAYGIVSLAPALSTPLDTGPLNGSVRYVAVVFPVFLAVAMWLEGHRRATLVLGGVFAIGLAYCSARFGSWRWVA